jgi:Zn-dependent protease with chaperone function
VRPTSRSPLHQLLSSLPVYALYAATLLLELPVILTRWFLTFIVVSLLLLVLRHSTAGAIGFSQIAVIPTLWSMFALLTAVGGGWWWRQNLGGRAPSERERDVYRAAFDLLRHQTRIPLREPSSWFVLDTPHPDAAVCGHTLMLSRGLLESEHLLGVLAHELGHLATSDGKLTAALNRLVIHPPPRPAQDEQRDAQPERGRRTLILADDRTLLAITLIGGVVWLMRKIIRFAKGGFALRLTAPLWGMHWREREYTADQYATHLQQGEELADFLDIHALIHDHPVPFIWLTEHTHPPTELRIDKLRTTPRLQAA